MRSPVLTDLVHNHTSIMETLSGEITSSDRPGTQSYISELYRTYLVKSPVLTDLIHNHTSIIETISGEITSSDWPDTQSYINYRDHIGEITSSDGPGTHYIYQNYADHIWWNHQFSLTWYTIIHIRIIQNISGEITSFDWPDTQSNINYRDLIWWNHQFWPTWYTLYIS